MRLDSQADVTRLFWALFLDSTVESDGQVRGFREWQQAATDYAKAQAERFCYWTWVKIERDRSDPEECVAGAVSALRQHLRLHAEREQPEAFAEYQGGGR